MIYTSQMMSTRTSDDITPTDNPIPSCIGDQTNVIIFTGSFSGVMILVSLILGAFIIALLRKNTKLNRKLKILDNVSAPETSHNISRRSSLEEKTANEPQSGKRKDNQKRSSKKVKTSKSNFSLSSIKDDPNGIKPVAASIQLHEQNKNEKSDANYVTSTSLV